MYLHFKAGFVEVDVWDGSMTIRQIKAGRL